MGTLCTPPPHPGTARNSERPRPDSGHVRAFDAARLARCVGGAVIHVDPQSVSRTGDVATDRPPAEGKGRSARAPSLLAVARSAPPYWPAGLDSIVQAAADDPVLVSHSNAGLF